MENESNYTTQKIAFDPSISMNYKHFVRIRKLNFNFSSDEILFENIVSLRLQDSG